MRSSLLILVVVVGFLLSDKVFPALKQSSGGWGESTEYGRLLKSGKRESIQGNVLSFEEVTPLAGMEPGVQMKLDVGGRELNVHLGPRWFIMERDLNITRGEPVTIVGLTIRLGKQSVVVAEELKKKNGAFVLRHTAGELKRETSAEPEKDPEIQALTILSKRCASCHQQKDHPGAAFLKEKALDDKETVATLIRVLKSGTMPPEHKHFKNTVEGKLVLNWLQTQR